MINKRQKTNDPKDAPTSEGPNASTVEARASDSGYPKGGQLRKENPDEGKRGGQLMAHYARARVSLAEIDRVAASIRLEGADGKVWSYRGKRARVAAMLSTMPDGVTQWDCLPWHTRLGGTIHALRRDGLEISTELEGECRHARYRLSTFVRLIKQAKNSEGPVNLHRVAP